MPTAIYAAADLHLEGFPWTKREEFYGDAFKALDEAKKLILGDTIVPNNKKSVILGGDITNKPSIEDDTAMALRIFVSDLYAAGIPVYYINGNHDMAKRDSPGHVGVFGGIHINKKLLNIGDFTVYGMDWMPRMELKQHLAEIPECDIVVMHCAYEHLLSYAGAFDISKNDLPAHLKDVFVGDVHVTDITLNANNTRIVSPGPLHPCSISQKGPHGIMRILSDARMWEFLPIPTRHVLDYDFKKLQDLSAEEIASRIKADAALCPLRPHCVLRYVSDISDKVESVISMIKDVVHLHEKKVSAGNLLTSTEIEKIMVDREETSLEKEVASFADADPEVLAYVHKLLTSTEPERVLVESYNSCVGKSEQIPY